jgi:phosphoribosylformimino-5-aminoimidazole carboxamide ribotide isomerase
MIIPAIDLIDGNVVRLYQGDYAQKTEYKLNPIDVVNDYANQGAKWLHIVDLTGAKDTTKRQLKLIADMVATKRMDFQAGGGIRAEQDVAQLLDIGVKRVVIGSLAVKEPELVKSWVRQYGSEAIVLALDINIDASGNKFIATHGWQENSGVSINMCCVPILAATAP